MKIILDIYGGDNSPQAPIQGAVEYLKECNNKDVCIVLAGDENVINEQLKKCDFSSDRIEILNAPSEITCHDEPTLALRQKKDSSMAMGLKMLAEGNADGLVSSGSTGALFAGSISKVRRIQGVTRPALTPVLPTLKNTQTLLIDSGANADCIPEYLVQFALMGSIYMKSVCGVEKPRVALICNGTEDEKGNELVKNAHQLIKQLPVNFVGNIEARDALTGEADVLVCDGFTGNVLLKSVEGTIKAFSAILKEELMSSFKSKIGALLIKDKVSNLKKRFDYREAGGAPFLGINGCVIKAHGSSDARAYKNAILQAEKYISSRITEKISEEIKKLRNIEE